MDKHAKLLSDSLYQAHLAVSELQNSRPNDPMCARLNNVLWIVRHATDAAAAASVILEAELASLKDSGVKL